MPIGNGTQAQGYSWGCLNGTHGAPRGDDSTGAVALFPVQAEGRQTLHGSGCWEGKWDQEEQGGGCAWNSALWRSRALGWVQQEKGVQSLKLFCVWRREIPGVLLTRLFLPLQLTTSTVLQAGNGSSGLPLRISSCHLIHIRGSPLHCQGITIRVGFAASALQWGSLWEGYTQVCSALLFPMSISWCWICSASLCKRQLFHRSALPPDNQCKITLFYCLCTSSGFCIGALGTFGHFTILKAKVFKHLNPKWTWKLKLSNWALSVGRKAFKPHTRQQDIFYLGR